MNCLPKIVARSLSLSFLFFIAATVFSQDLDFTCKLINSKGQPLEGVKGSIFWKKNSSKPDIEVLTKNTGIYQGTVGLNTEWYIKFTKAGYKTKMLYINSEVFGDKRTIIKYTFENIVMTEGAGGDIIEKPSIKLRYDKNKLNFTEEREEAAQENTVNEKYLDLMTKGNKNFVDKNYDAAIKNFKDAIKERPNEQEPKNRITEIENIIKNSPKENKPSTDAYANLIKTADKQFAIKDLVNARENYEQALKNKPDSKYPKDQIKKIEDILSKAAYPIVKNEKESPDLTKKYNDLIVKADKAFGKKDYTEAKDKYSQANKIRPRDNYSLEKIKQIDNILREIESTISAIQASTPKGQEDSKEDAIKMITQLEALNMQMMQAEKAARKKLDEENEKRKSININTKYETSNPLTSLYDVIDEYEKKKNKTK